MVNVLFLLFKSNIFDTWIIYQMTSDFRAAHFIQVDDLQTMTNTPVKFQKDRRKTVGGVANTRYLLLEGEQNQGTIESRILRGLFWKFVEFGDKIVKY